MYQDPQVMLERIRILDRMVAIEKMTETLSNLAQDTEIEKREPIIQAWYALRIEHAILSGCRGPEC